jgi:plasmid stabilization system protein ParE
VSLDFHPLALGEIEKAVAWYERKAGLGGALLNRIEATLTAVRAAPGSYPVHPADRRSRRALVERFPYAIVFTIVGQRVFVVAVAHTRRRPAYWRRRGAKVLP